MPKRRQRAITYHGVLVLQAMAHGCRYGFDIMRETGLPSGTVYPLLRRLEASGKVRSRWEAEHSALRDGRPARRYYELGASGRKELAEGLARIRAQRRIIEGPVEEGPTR